MKLTDFYKHVLTSSTYAENHLNNSRKEGISTAERSFHKVIGNIERVPLVGALVGLAEGACRRISSLTGRASKPSPSKNTQTTDTLRERLLQSAACTDSEDLESAVSKGDLKRVKALLADKDRLDDNVV